MKSYTATGIAFGVALALIMYFGGFYLLLLSVVLGGLGGLVGAHYDKKIDLSALLSGFGNRG